MNTPVGDFVRKKSSSRCETQRQKYVVEALNLARQNDKFMHVPCVPMLKERNVRTGFFERNRARPSSPAAGDSSTVQFAYITARVALRASCCRCTGDRNRWNSPEMPFGERGARS